MKFKTLLACSLFTSASAFADFYVENGNVMAEVQTYTKGPKTIVLIDMVHVAPKDFYKGVNNVLKSYKSSKPVILQEGVKHCEEKNDVFTVPGDKANFDVLADLYKRRAEFDTASAEAAVKDAGFVKKVCTAGSSNEQAGFIGRFASRFSMYGLVAGVTGLRSQGSIEVYPKGMELASGDIASARFDDPISRALAGSLVQCMLALKAEGGCVQFKKWASTPEGEKITEEMILGRRNDVLLGATFNAMKLDSRFGSDYNYTASNLPTFDTVILPWGANHMPGGLTQDIESMGFKKSAKSGVKFTNCAQAKKNILMNGLFKEDSVVKEACGL